MANWHNESTDRLVRVLTNLSSEEECYRLLDDLCTIKEVMDMAQRLEVAILLKNRTNYPEINRKVTDEEYQIVEDALFDSGIEDGYVQDESSASSDFIPDFDNSGV